MREQTKEGLPCRLEAEAVDLEADAVPVRDRYLTRHVDTCREEGVRREARGSRIGVQDYGIIQPRRGGTKYN